MQLRIWHDPNTDSLLIVGIDGEVSLGVALPNKQPMDSANPTDLDDLAPKIEELRLALVDAKANGIEKYS